MNIPRRAFIQSALAGWVVFNGLGAKAFGQNANKIEKQKKIVWVMLRGAMDSLQAVLPVNDPHLNAHRQFLVAPIVGKALPLEKGFALHPKFQNLHNWYQSKEFAPVVAVASGYRERSHFDAQDQMESGLNITDHESGWLARAVNIAQGKGLAISQTVPISLRGTSASNTWFPPQFNPTDDDLLRRLEALYKDNQEFSELLSKAVSNRGMLAMNQKGKTKPNFSLLAKRCGELLNREDSASCAMLELGGWDTHNNQHQRLNRQFEMLDKGLLELKNALKDTWQDTVVIVTTEFGRTVAVNGTKGTDHGTAAGMFLVGGAVKGKQVLGDWPGLAPDKLFEKRDLMPTSDVRSWMASVLHQHWDFSILQVAQVFPDVLPMDKVIIG